MGRRVAVVGVVLAVLGIALESWSLHHLSTTLPVDEVARSLHHVVAFGPTLGAVCTTAGTVVLGMALLIRLTNRPPVQGRHRSLLWSGSGLVVLCTLIEVLIMAGPVVTAIAGREPAGLLVVIQTLAVGRLVGAVLLGLWLTGVVTDPRPRRRSAASRPRRPAGHSDDRVRRPLGSGGDSVAAG